MCFCLVFHRSWGGGEGGARGMGPLKDPVYPLVFHIYHLIINWLAREVCLLPGMRPYICDYEVV